MTRPNPIEAVIVDLGEVVIRINEHRTASAWAPGSPYTPEQILQRIAYESDVAGRLYTGQWSLRQAYEAMRKRLGLAVDYERFAAGWDAMIGEDIPETRAALEQLPATLPLYLLSNTTASHVEALSDHWLLRRVRRVFASYEMGIQKPDRRVYEQVLAELSLPGDNVLFFDDKQANVDAALAVGIRAVRVTGPNTIGRELSRLGVIDGWQG